MVGKYYILKGHDVVPCLDATQWARWFESADRVVAKDTIGDSVVSTVFVGVAHRFGDKLPLVFETLVFGGSLSNEMDRYSTWDEAVSGHNTMIKRVQMNEKLV